MNNKITINPLNCAYGIGLNSIATFSDAEYNNANTRSILYKDAFSSWFKMKSVTQASYIEPAIFGLTASDKIKVEFEMCNISGIGGASIKIVGVSSTGVTSDLQILNTLDQKETHFKKYSLEFALNNSALNNEGIVINIRQKNLNNEVIIKNLTIEVFNPSIDLKQVVKVVNCKNRYEKIINGSVLSEVKDYSSLKDVKKTIDDKGLHINSSDITGFKGLFFEVGNNKYRNPKALYVSGNVTSGTVKVTNDIYNKNNIQKALTVENDLPLGNIKKIIYFEGTTNTEYDYLDIGTKEAVNFTLDTVVFFKNRFDDISDLNYSTILERK